MELSLKEIIEATKGTLVKGDFSEKITRVSTDTRTIKPGDTYLALKGVRFNGHHFCEEALKKGAKGLIVSEDVSSAATYVLKVADTERALGDIAQAWRNKFKIPFIGLTGSSGKTTTKDMLACLLGVKGLVCKTEGNLNNLIGLPQTLMTLTAAHQFAVIEMGMNRFNEIDRLAEITNPDIGIITNVGHAHLEGVGSIDGVAKAKGELFARLKSQAKALVNADDARVKALPTQAQKILYGSTPDVTHQLMKVTYTAESMTLIIRHDKQEMTYTMPFSGEYLAKNFLAASSVAITLGLAPAEIQKGIQNFELGKMRGTETILKNGTLLVVDCYNANPDATKAAVKAVQDKFPLKKKIAVLGSMLELGKDSGALHEEVGSYTAKAGFNALYAFGPEGFKLKSGFGSQHSQTYDVIEKLSDDVASQLDGSEVVLIKGSRGMQMERVAEFLKNYFNKN